MQNLPRRAGRRPLAHTIVLLAAAGALGACANETTAPAIDTIARVAANTAAPSLDPYTTSVDVVVERVADSPVYGTTVRLRPTCSTPQTFDLIIDLEQWVKTEQGRQLVQGSTEWPLYVCEEVNPSLIVVIPPADARFDFEPGRGIVRVRNANYRPGVEPLDFTTRVRIVAD